MIRLTKKHQTKNVFRFYLIQVVPGLFGQWGVLREWGRIGQPGTVRKDWYGDEAQAQAASSKLLNQKLKRGYSQEGTVYA
jgi:predicted DNA-binding WGR domain protein